MKSSVLKLFLVIFGLVVSASASAYNFQYNGLYYRITSSTDKTVAVTFKNSDHEYYKSHNQDSSGYSGAITIPSTVTYSGTTYRVTSIDDEAFSYEKSLTSITIPASIETIWEEAFYGCTSLSTVRFLDGGPIDLISKGADDSEDYFWDMFYYCPITYFYLGRDIDQHLEKDDHRRSTSISHYAGFYALTYAFSRVETLVIGANVSESTIYDFPIINSSASITVSGSHPTLKSKENVIYSHDEKTLVRYFGQDDFFVPQTVTTIADGAFKYCKSYIIELPRSVTKIGKYAFSGCKNLSSIDLSSVTNIGTSAFYNCTGLTSVELPASINSTGDYTFYGCTGLTSMELPASINSIGNYTFYGCSGLTSVELPAVTSIGSYAFSGCTGLKFLNMPAVKSIGSYAFSGDVYYYYDDRHEVPACTALSSVEMPAVTNIDDSAFSGCTGLTSMELPASIFSIGNYTFYGCTGLTSVELPASIFSIGYSAFYGCTRLNSIELPSSLTSIGQSAFSGCNINSIHVNIKYLSTNSILHSYLPSSASWKYYVNGEPVTNHFKVPEGTEKLGNWLFYNARDLTSVELPESLTSIGSSVFQSCTGLTSVELPAVTTIGSSAFQSCTGLTSVELPASLTSIGSSAFQSCTGLTSVAMPAVTTIGSSAFQNTSLKQIDIPASITSIGSNAFAGTAPTAFICRATTPPSLGTGNNFGGKQKLYVPYESVGEYEKKWALGSNYDYLPLLDVMFFEKTDKAAYQAALSGKTKNGITSVAFYDGGIGDDLTESILKRGMNPNCLYFLPDEAGLKGDNIISLNDYTADYVALTDAYAYECPIPFRVNVIEYQHNPSVWATGHSGWETLCLPFAASEYEGSESGTLFPIILGSSGNFWLRRYVGSSANNVYFSSTYDGQMEANTPYLVAFPGSTMGDGHLEGQTITFRGYGIDLPVTKAPELHKNEFIFTGNYDKTPDGVTGWALNAEGSSFVQSSTVGNDPFRGYFKHKDATTGSNQLKISFGTFDETTGIFTPELNAEDSAASQNIYDLQGRRTTDSQQGVSIKNGKKHLSL